MILCVSGFTRFVSQIFFTSNLVALDNEKCSSYHII
jgi:hypothetical protein